MATEVIEALRRRGVSMEDAANLAVATAQFGATSAAASTTAQFGATAAAASAAAQATPLQMKVKIEQTSLKIEHAKVKIERISPTSPSSPTSPQYSDESGESEVELCESCGVAAAFPGTYPECISCYQEH